MPLPVEGDAWQSLGGNEKCPIQGLTLHYPTEYNAAVMRDLLSHLRETGTVNETDYESALSSINEEQRNLDTAKILLAMLGMEPATAELEPMN